MTLAELKEELAKTPAMARAHAVHIRTATQAEAAAIAADCHAWMAAHVPGYCAEQWDTPREVEPGMFEVSVDDRVIGALDAGLRDAAQTESGTRPWQAKE